MPRATINNDHVPADEVTCRREQEYRGVGNVVNRAKALDWDIFHHFFEKVVAREAG